MSARNELPEHGGGGGNDFGRHSCPDGEVIKTISGRAGGRIDQICASCTDGTSLGCYGGGGGNPFTRSGPFTSAYGRAGGGIDNLFDAGGGGGDGWADGCPTGRYLTGIRGRAGGRVDRIGFECGVDKKHTVLITWKILCAITSVKKSSIRHVPETCLLHAKIEKMSSMNLLLLAIVLHI